MDFFEHYFGFDPDAGSGALETLYVVLVLLMVVLVVFRGYFLGLLGRVLDRLRRSR